MLSCPITKIFKSFRVPTEILFLYIFLMFIVLTPLLTPNDWLIRKELLETILLFIFSLSALITAYLCEKKTSQRKAEADEVLNYLGTLNLQFAHTKSVFEDIKKIPESKTEFKILLSSLAEKFLSINSADWLIFRIIDPANKKTLIEHVQARGGKNVPQQNKISNRELLENQPSGTMKECVLFSSSQENLGIKTFCILSTKEINENQKTVMGIITNNLSIYYLLFISIFYGNKE